MVAQEISELVEDYTDTIIDYATLFIGVDAKPRPWDSRTQELVEQTNSWYLTQQRLLAKYAQAEYLAQKRPSKKNERKFKRAQTMLTQSYFIGHMADGEIKPWDEEAFKVIELIEAKTDIEKFLFRSHAKLQYKADHFEPKEEKTIHNNLTPKIQKAGVSFYNNLIAATLQGQFVDEIATKYEQVTHVPKKRAEKLNTLVSSLEHIPVMLGTYTAMEGMADAGDSSLLVTGAFALGTTGWNIYRFFKNDDVARPAIGYGAALMHTKYFFKKAQETTTMLTDTYQQRAKRDGTTPLFAAMKTTLEDITSFLHRT